MPDHNQALQLLTVTPTGDKKISNINILLPDGRAATIYTLHRQKSGSRLELRYADASGKGLKSVGTMKFHTLSSKIDVTLHSVSFTMARRDPLSSGHHFMENSLGGDIQWKETKFLGSGMQLLDSQKRQVAKYSSKLKLGSAQAGFSALLRDRSGTPGLEIFVPAQDRLFDLIVITGLAAAEYRRQSDEDWGIVKKIGKDSGKDELEEIVAGVFGV